VCHCPDGGPQIGGQVATLPYDVAACEKVVGKNRHAKYGIEDEADEVWEGRMRDAVCGPRTMMVHLWDTAADA
jgi:hypothetical protein